MLRPEDRDIAKALMRKFFRNNIWGKHHWREDTLPKGFKPHLRGKVMDVAEELRRMGWLVKHPTGHGDQWNANINMLREIEEFIRD